MIILYTILAIIFVGYVTAVILASYVNWTKKQDGFDGRPWNDMFDPMVWFSFAIGHIVSKVPNHVFEQYVLRYYNSTCRKCILSGECNYENEDGDLINNCGCPPDKKAGSPYEECDGIDSDDLSGYNKIIWSKEEYEQQDWLPVITVDFKENKK
jgi:hypothetical protein